MRAIKTITGVTAVLLGLIFIGIAIVVLAYFPGALEGYDREPEDLIFHGIYFAVSAFVGIITWLAGVILLRERDDFVISARTVARLLTLSVVILIAFSAIGFIASDPIDKLFRLLIVPALLLAWSIYLIRTASNDRSHDPESD